MKYFFAVLICFCAFTARGQITDSTRTDSLQNRRSQTEAQRKQQARDDSTKTTYVNPGKVAARRSVIRSAILPGWGQLTNYRTLVRRKDEFGRRDAQFWEKGLIIIKTAAVYAGAAYVTLNLSDNKKQYRVFKNEILYRAAHEGQSPENSAYANIATTQLIQARDNYDRNVQILYFSYGLIYVANLVDTYVTARLNYFDVGDSRRTWYIKPGIMQPHTGAAWAVVPTITFKLRL